MKKNMKRLLAGILVYVIIAAGVLPVLAEEAGRITPDESVSASETSGDNEQKINDNELNKIDFSSMRLMIGTDDESKITDKDNIISSYDGVYLLQYKTEYEAKNAYSAYYGKVDMLDVDVQVKAADDTSTGTSEQTVMTKEDNPLTELADETAKAEPVKDQVIALIDTGCSYADEAVSMIGDSTDDDNGHGNSMFICMINHNITAKVLSIKALDSKGVGDASAVYAAIKYATKRGVSIINLSLSGVSTTDNAIIKTAVDEAVDAGITVVGAAGNDGNNVKYYTPGSIEKAIIVGACDQYGKKLSASNYGSTVDYNLYLNSTSEAAAVMSAYLSINKEVKDVNNNHLIFTPDYVSDEGSQPSGDGTLHTASSLTTDESSFFTITSDGKNHDTALHYIDSTRAYCVELGKGFDNGTAQEITPGEAAGWNDVNAQRMCYAVYYLHNVDKHGLSDRQMEQCVQVIGWLIQAYSENYANVTKWPNEVGQSKMIEVVNGYKDWMASVWGFGQCDYHFYRRAGTADQSVATFGLTLNYHNAKITLQKADSNGNALTAGSVSYKWRWKLSSGAWSSEKTGSSDNYGSFTLTTDKFTDTTGWVTFEVTETGYDNQHYTQTQTRTYNVPMSADTLSGVTYSTSAMFLNTPVDDYSPVFNMNVQKTDGTGTNLTGTMQFKWRASLKSGDKTLSDWTGWYTATAENGSAGITYSPNIKYSTTAEIDAQAPTVALEIQEISYSDTAYVVDPATRPYSFTYDQFTTGVSSKPENSTDYVSSLVNGHVYTITSKLSGKVLDVEAGACHSGANVQMYTANGSAAQLWRATVIDGVWTLTNVNSGKALDVKNGEMKDSTNVDQYQINNTYSQHWYIEYNGNTDNSFRIKNTNISAGVKALDVAGGSTADGANVQIYAYGENNAAQKWCFTDKTEYSDTQIVNEIEDGGVYYIASSLNFNKLMPGSQRVLDVAGGSTGNKANIQVYGNNGSNAQKWRAKENDDGTFVFENINSGKVLDVENGIMNNGTNVQQFDANTSKSQSWLPVLNSDGTFMLKNKQDNSYALDVSGGVNASDVNVDIYSQNTTAAQKWYFIQANTGMFAFTLGSTNATSASVVNTRPEPVISTTAVIDGGKSAGTSASSVILDTVNCSNLISGQTYYAVGTLMDKSTQRVLKINGNDVPSVTSDDFAADGSSAAVEIAFNVNTSLLAGKDIVVFEKIYIKGETEAIVKHENPDDASQTVHVDKTVPEPGTLAKAVDYPSHYVNEDETWTIGVKIPEEWLSTSESAYKFSITDTLDSRLTYSGNFKVYIEKGADVENWALSEPAVKTRYELSRSNYALSEANPLTVDFNATGKTAIGQYILDHGDTSAKYVIIIEFTTKINETAAAAVHIPNGATLAYGTTPTELIIPDDRKPYVYTGELDALKINLVSGQPVSGVKFTVSNAPSDDTLLKKDENGFIVKHEDVGYSDASVCVLTTGTDGKVTLAGVADGNYYLKEISTAAGYSLLNDYIKITVQNGKTAETGGSVPVIGNASHLKVLSTGGIGTAVFITAGLAIIAGTLAMALKVRKKKKD